VCYRKLERTAYREASSQNIIRVIKWHMKYWGEKRKAHRVLVSICEGNRLFEDLGIEWRIISKWILQNWMGGNATSSSIKCREFVTSCWTVIFWRRVVLCRASSVSSYCASPLILFHP
jgi:hypothetical protein